MSSSAASPVKTSPRPPSPSPRPISQPIEIHRPTTPTRRPLLNAPSQLPPPQKTPAVEPAPLYVAHELLSPNPPDISEDTQPPHYETSTPSTPPFFEAILDDDEAQLERLIARNPDLVNTKDAQGRTPLYRAVIAYDGRIEIVKLLLDAGADVDEWSTEIVTNRHLGRRTEHNAQRTALMAASARNRLAIVRLLLSPSYNANSMLVAPDGQHALRLASSVRAREIVALLPSLRAGGWKRMKHRSRPHVEAIKRTGKVLCTVGKFIVWEIPKFFLWTLPIEVGQCMWYVLKSLAKRVGRVAIQVWNQVEKFPAVVKRFCAWLPGAVWAAIKMTPGMLRAIAVQTWEALKAFAKWAWRVITVHLPKATVGVLKFLWRVVKRIWKFLTVTFPDFIVSLVKLFWDAAIWFVKWVWKIITVRVPEVSVMVYHAIVDALGTAGEWVVKVLKSIASLLHTFVSFLLRQCTFANLMQGIKHTFHFFFVSVPKGVWEAMKGTYNLCYKIVKGLFGFAGEVLWLLGELLVTGVLWFPKMIGRILLNCWKIVVGGLKELRLWVNPKADV